MSARSKVRIIKGTKWRRAARVPILASLLLLGTSLSFAQVRTSLIRLDDLSALESRNVKTEIATYKGRRGIRVTDAAPTAGDGERLVILSKTEFQDGAIEIDLTGEPSPGVAEGARGFVGVAFRSAADGKRYECFYIRPTNGRAEDQVRRNHSVQYISFPEFPWQRLRKEFPEKYESYADLIPGEWTHVKIEARGDKARLYINGASQPTLIVNDLKQGQRQGGIALWIGFGTIAHFSSLRVSK